MADSNFSLNKILSWLKGFLASMPSPLPGWDMSDAKVKQDGDNFSSYFQFKSEGGLKDERTGKEISDVAGNAIELDVLLKTLNSQTVLSPLMSGLNNMSQNDTKEGKALLDVLFGKESESENKENTDNTEPTDTEEPVDNTNTETTEQLVEDASGATSISDTKQNIFAADLNKRYEQAKSKGTGLLGVDLSSYTAKSLANDPVIANYDNKDWSWGKIATEYLTYALECQIPGDDYGSIDGVSLDQCSKLISEYLLNRNVIGDVSEVQVNVTTLILPILGRMQSALATYFVDAYKKNPGIQEVEDAVYKEEAPKPEPETVAVFDPEGNFAEHVDISTPEGQAHLQELQSRGYSIMESKKISIKLKKINGSIDLLGLKSNYSPTETLDDLDDIIYQDEFMGALSEEPQSYSINVDDEGYDIEQCEECEVDPCTSLNSVMNTAIIMYRNLYVLHWMAKGNDMMKLHILTEELYGELIQEIDTLGELLVEKCGTVQNLDFEWTPIAVRDYEFQESLILLKDFIQNYIDTIDYAYPNQTSDVQSMFDEWLRYWNKQLNYFVKGQEEQ